MYGDMSMFRKYTMSSLVFIFYLFGLTLINVSQVHARGLEERVCPEFGPDRMSGILPIKERISCQKNLTKSLQDKLEAMPRIGGRHILKRKREFRKSFPPIDCDTEVCWQQKMKLENKECNENLWKSGEKSLLLCYIDLTVALQHELTFRLMERRISEEVAKDEEEIQTQLKGGQVYRNVRCIPNSLGCDWSGYVEVSRSNSNYNSPCSDFFNEDLGGDIRYHSIQACSKGDEGALKQLGMHHFHSMVDDCNKEEKFSKWQDKMKISDMKLPPTTNFSSEMIDDKKRACQIRAACKFFKEAPDYVRALDFSNGSDDPDYNIYSMTEMCKVLTTNEVHSNSCDDESRPKGTKRFWTCPTACYEVNGGLLDWHKCKTVKAETRTEAEIKFTNKVLFGKDLGEAISMLPRTSRRESGRPEGTPLSEQDTIDLGLKTPAQKREMISKKLDDEIKSKVVLENDLNPVSEENDEISKAKTRAQISQYERKYGLDLDKKPEIRKKVDEVVPERVFVPSFRYLGCGFTLPCTSVWWSFEDNAPVERREVLVTDARITEVDNWFMWATCTFISLVENTLTGSNITCVHTQNVQ